MRIIGVDFGDRRTGVAVSDPMGWTAQGLEVVVGDIAVAAGRVADLAREYSAETIIVGYPLNMNGSAGFRADRTDEFINALKERIENGTTAIIKWDERLTTAEASRVLRETGVKQSPRGKREKGRLDIISAVILLQSFLDSNQKR